MHARATQVPFGLQVKSAWPQSPLRVQAKGRHCRLRGCNVPAASMQRCPTSQSQSDLQAAATSLQPGGPQFMRWAKIGTQAAGGEQGRRDEQP